MKNLVVVLLLVVAATGYAQIDPMQAEINSALARDGITTQAFVIGIGTASKNLSNAEELARENAIADVYMQVAHRVRAIILANKDTAFQDNVAEHYSTVAQMPVVTMPLPRIVEVPLSPGRSSNDKHTYVVVAFNREEIVKLYVKKAGKLREAINATLAQNTAGNPTDAARQYLNTYRRYEELKEAELIMVGAEYNPNPRDAFDRLYAYTKAEGSQQQTINYLDTYFQNTVPVMLNSAANLATVIVTQFEMQGASSPSRDRVQLDPFTYAVTEVPTNFSAVLVNAIEREMTKKWDTILKARLIANPEHPYSTVHSLGFGRDVNSRLTGTYWERGNKVTVRATLRDVNTGEFQAVAIVRFNKHALTDIRTDRYKLHKYETIVQDLMIDAKERIGSDNRPTTTTASINNQGPQTGEMTTPVVRNSGFRVQLRSDKGFGSQTYAVGERARFFVNVNQPAYIRLLYQQDGRWSQLSEDQYVKSEQITQWLEIPGDFVFAEPEGVGELVVQAKTTEFKPITNFYYEGGYRYIGKPPSLPAELTLEARYKEMLETEFMLKGPINKNFKKDVERADFLLKGPTNRDFQQDSPMQPIPKDDAAETSTASIYLTTIPRD